MELSVGKGPASPGRTETLSPVVPVVDSQGRVQLRSNLSHMAALEISTDHPHFADGESEAQRGFVVCLTLRKEHV